MKHLVKVKNWKMIIQKQCWITKARMSLPKTRTHLVWDVTDQCQNHWPLIQITPWDAKWCLTKSMQKCSWKCSSHMRDQTPLIIQCLYIPITFCQADQTWHQCPSCKTRQQSQLLIRIYQFIQLYQKWECWERTTTHYKH